MLMRPPSLRVKVESVRENLTRGQRHFPHIAVFLPTSLRANLERPQRCDAVHETVGAPKMQLCSTTATPPVDCSFVGGTKGRQSPPRWARVNGAWAPSKSTHRGGFACETSSRARPGGGRCDPWLPGERP